ncbi:Cys/Met metabolism PLP-dependent enzyme-domain-containing protein [Lentinula boryana]|uniref:Cysteine-S-conjugate beta-lyase n=1 Tax=Lentinula boryana TaxID=40481 RepID=A0ABQ8Q9A0_9AGAR|nr:Cys/Met metabolism PLP-dependent enzyme-domain-containing protein [Lentinula boryana]
MAPTIDTKATAVHHDLPTPDPETPIRPRQPYKLSTLCVAVENPSMKDQYGSSSVPIYQSATFKGVGNEYDYSRSGNPTRSHLEHHIAKISSAARAFAVSSGMAALDVILRLLRPGDEIIAGDDLYGGTNRLLTFIRTHVGVTVHHVDTTNPNAVIPFIHPTKTAMVLLESPTNPLLKIADLALISKEVKERAPNAIVVVDNTMMSPYLQRPLEHGADIVYDSATKYLSGHHDLMAGMITCNRDDLAKQIAFTINSVGNALTPIDCFLLLRGVKTMAVRMDRQQSTSQLVATYLYSLGFKVHYPGLPDHPGREIHQRISDGNGAVLSFETGDKELSEKIVGSTRLWGISVSFGCVNSLISMPCVMSHASIDPATRAARGLPEDLIRLCVGIEDSSDLLDDLEHALIDAGAIALSAQQNKYIRVPPAHAVLNKAVEQLAIGGSNSKGVDQEWFVSAPGKVILFGEHAVVHGVTAIAASVDLRCYGLATPRNDGKLSARFNDIDNFQAEWDIESLPWDASAPLGQTERHPEDLDLQLIEAIQAGPLKELGSDKSQARNAALAFLYLYIKLMNTHRASVHFAVRATLPVGAGLGSSASFSTCAATALLLLSQRITIPSIPPPISADHPHLSHHGRHALERHNAEEANRWAFTAEKILHGNPSGVDNSVAVFGGALTYNRPGFGKTSGMESIQGFGSLRFLLTNSKVPRDTKKLVAGVGLMKLEQPEVVGSILEAIENISAQAKRSLADSSEFGRDSLLRDLSAMIIENHKHLVSLGVSHPSLEMIKETTAAPPYNLSTKLTGAGGGGCAVTLIPDDFSEALMKDLLSELVECGFDPYLTSVGGSGMGILSPYPEHSNTSSKVLLPGQVTPPETPDEAADSPYAGASFRSLFETKSLSELTVWAHSLGKWLYV